MQNDYYIYSSCLGNLFVETEQLIDEDPCDICGDSSYLQWCGSKEYLEEEINRLSLLLIDLKYDEYSIITDERLEDINKLECELHMLRLYSNLLEDYEK